MTNLVTRTNVRCLYACLTVALALLLTSGMAHGQACPSGACVQEADNSPVPATSPSTVGVAFTGAQTAGNTNVVVVGWGGSQSVLGVSDTAGNAYAMAAGTNNFVGGAGEASQNIWYAKGIKAGPNTVTVTFQNGTVSFPDVFVLEYSGLVDLDSSSGNSGSGGTASSGPVTPTIAGDLLVVGGTTNGQFNATGGSFAVRKLSSDGNIVGDQAASVATATDGVAGGWVLQAAAFSTAATIPGAAPTFTSIAPTTGSDTGGDGITITGTNFRPGAMVLLGTAPTGVSAVNCAVQPGGTSIVCNTPPDNAGPKDVTVVNTDGTNTATAGAAAFTFTASTPSITSIAPSTGPTNGGTQVVITGSGFLTGAAVTLNIPSLETAGLKALPVDVSAVTSTTITGTVPALPAAAADAKVTNTDQGTSTTTGAYTYAVGTGPINYIQRGDAATGSSAPSVPVTMVSPQTKGDLNLVIVGWSDTSHAVTSVTDTEGNTYAQASNAIAAGGLSQVIYYAKNIAGDGVTPNTITVVFNGSAGAPDVRVLEYGGLDPTSPLDQAVSNSGTSSLADTGPCTTTSPVEVIVAAATVANSVTGTGPGFIPVDLTNDGDNVEHQITSVAGSCEAQVPVASGAWVVQSVSLKAAAGATGPNFTLTANAPTSATVTAGSSASYGLTVADENGFTGMVTLACSGQPTGATCSFSPKSPVSAGAVTVTILTPVTAPTATSTVTITGTSGSLTHTAQVTLVVNANTTPGFTMSASALSPASITPGGTATSTITLTGRNGFNASNVSLSCLSITGGGTPAPTCSFGAVSNGSSTLTVSTTANSSSKALRSTGVFYAVLLPIGGITLLGAGFTSRRKKALAVLLLCLAITGLVFMVACGGGSSSGGGGTGGTPAGTYTITVQGTATGATTQTQTLTLTVQ